MARRLFSGLANQLAKPSRFTQVPKAPEDAILGVTIAYKADPNPSKINVGVGAYRTNDGAPYVLKAVRFAEERMMSRSLDMEYLPVIGNQGFVKKSCALAYGNDCTQLQEGSIAGIQTLSGTGACRMSGEFLARFHPIVETGKKPLVLVPTPTWANHPKIYAHSGCDVGSYEYYDPANKAVNFNAMLDSLSTAPEDSAVLLHATAHNPTGCDLTPEQWIKLSSLMKDKNLIPLFDSAYQGFTSGDVDEDAFAIRQFVQDGHQVILAQSFSKNFGLYGHRVGCMSVLTESPKEAEAINSQLKIIARAMYSNPPLHGARIVDEVLGDDELEPMWRAELKEMAERIMTSRSDLLSELQNLGSELCWKHIVDQRGMFCYSGLTKEQVKMLRDQFSVYMTDNGRISMAGVTKGNYKYLANAIHQVTSS